MSSNVFENPEGDKVNSSKGKDLAPPQLAGNVFADEDEDVNADDNMDLDDLNIELSDDQERQEPFFLSSDDDGEYEFNEDNSDEYDEEFDFKDALRQAGNFKSKNRKKKSTNAASWKRRQMRSNLRELDPEVRGLLSQANEAFVRNDFQVALNLYREVIRKDNKNFSAYKTLGEIYKQQGKLNECCNYWFLAANINQKDGEFWASVAQLSAQLGHIDQALFCYGKAIQVSNHKDMDSILGRAKLYKEMKRYGRALEGFQKVHLAYPTDTGVIKELASVYVEQKRINDAIKLYMEVLDMNINYDNLTKAEKKNVPKFSWSELNILTELYTSQHSYEIGIRILKLLARWIQNRIQEVWWDDVDDDSEFDSRRIQLLEKRTFDEQVQEAMDKAYDLPIDIRFKLGALRLGLGQKDEAIRHFNYLKEEEDNIEDLYWDAGRLLESNGYYREALTFLSMCDPENHEEGIQLVSLLGKCNLEIGDYQEAARSYETVLGVDPKNVDIKVALAEVYFHLGFIGASQLLLKEVGEEVGDEQAGEGTSTLLLLLPQQQENENGQAPVLDLALIKTRPLYGNRLVKLSDEEKIEFENNAKRKVLEIYHRMERLESASLLQERVAITAWIRLASQLVDMFMSVRSFFPRDKNREFKGIVLYRRKKEMGIDERMARVLNLHEGITSNESAQYSRLVLTSKTDYRGLDYNIWFKIFVQYALLLAKFEDNLEYAIQIIHVASDVSVFVQDKNKEMTLKLVRLMFGIAQRDVNSTVMTYVRFFLSANQFSPFIYKFFMCCFASSAESWETFSNYNHQKFFLRQLKAFDSILTYQKNITGMATITADVKSIPSTNREHAELLYVYANLLGGSRSYVSSIVYLNRAYKDYNQDPMICLVLGLAHVHRSMQRLSSNRHMQLLQGVSYILQYKEHRLKNLTVYELQEIEYNLGRLFHMLGLTTLAVNFYEKVLNFQAKIEDSDYDLLMEAAYNLTLIYNINGNSSLAREITEKYLVV